MIAVSWTLAGLCSIPSAVLFKTDHCFIDLTPVQWQVLISMYHSIQLYQKSVKVNFDL